MGSTSPACTTRPLVVLMSGPPGSGKSTMARLLGDRLLLPVIEKDMLRQGVRHTLALPDYDGVPPGPPLFYGALQAFLDLGISVIGDMTLFRGPSEPDVKHLLMPRADVVCVHCFTVESVARFEARSAARGVSRAAVDEIMPLIVQLQRELVEPLDLGCPTITIDTTDGIEHHVATAADFIERTRRELLDHERAAQASRTAAP